MSRDLAEAANYSRRLSKLVTDGMATKLANGEYPGSAPLGYLNHQGMIYPDPQRAPIITRLFEKFSTGEMSLSTATKWVNEQGLRSKYRGKRIVKAVVWRILTDPAHYGVIRCKGKLYPGHPSTEYL